MNRILIALLFAICAQAGDWGSAVEVRHEDELCVAYQARIDGPYLVVRANLGPGWHTFAMDNKIRAEEKLAGKPPLSIDRATEIAPGAGVETAGPWYQSPPQDFSRPQLRWFSWGFEREALFVTKVRHAGSSASSVSLKAQACTDKICRNVDVAIPLPPAKAGTAAGSIDLKSLVQVR